VSLRGVLVLLSGVVTLIAGMSLLSYPWQFFILASLCMALPVIHSFQQKRVPDFFEPVWVFAGVYTVAYGYKAVLILVAPKEFVAIPEYFIFDEVAIDQAFFLSLLGLLSFYGGYYSRSHAIVQRWLPRYDTPEYNARRLRVGSLIGVWWAVAAFLFLVATTGIDLRGHDSFFAAEARNRFMAAFLGRGPLFLPITMLSLFVLTQLCIAVKTKTRADLTIFVLAFVSAEIIYAFVGGRLPFLTPIVGALVVWHYTVRPITLPTQGMFLLGILAAGGILGLLLTAEAISPYQIVKRLSGTFDAFDHLTVTLIRTEHVHFGQTILEDLFLTYLPRSVFPWKPIVYGYVRLQEELMPGIYQSYNQKATFPIGLIAEGYANLHIAGVVALPALVGVLLRTLHERAKRYKGIDAVLLGITMGGILGVIRGFGSFLVGTLMLILIASVFYRLRPPLRAVDRNGQRISTGVGTIV